MGHVGVHGYTYDRVISECSITIAKVHTNPVIRFFAKGFFEMETRKWKNTLQPLFGIPIHYPSFNFKIERDIPKICTDTVNAVYDITIDKNTLTAFDFLKDDIEQFRIAYRLIFEEITKQTNEKITKSISILTTIPSPHSIILDQLAQWNKFYKKQCSEDVKRLIEAVSPAQIAERTHFHTQRSQLKSLINDFTELEKKVLNACEKIIKDRDIQNEYQAKAASDLIKKNNRTC